MTARPSRRQLESFSRALQQAEQSAANLPSLAELARRRDAYLESLKS